MKSDRAFSRLGFVVDIIDYRDTSFIPAVEYDVFFGMGENAERISRSLNQGQSKFIMGPVRIGNMKNVPNKVGGNI